MFGQLLMRPSCLLVNVQRAGSFCLLLSIDAPPLCGDGERREKIADGNRQEVSLNEFMYLAIAY